jgi:hypothetical protein
VLSPLWFQRTTRIVTPLPRSKRSPPLTTRQASPVTPCAFACKHAERLPIIGAPVSRAQAGVSQLWSQCAWPARSRSTRSLPSIAVRTFAIAAVSTP